MLARSSNLSLQTRTASVKQLRMKNSIGHCAAGKFEFVMRIGHSKQLHTGRNFVRFTVAISARAQRVQTLFNAAERDWNVNVDRC